jgi:hypothetical protein
VLPLHKTIESTSRPKKNIAKLPNETETAPANKKDFDCNIIKKFCWLIIIKLMTQCNQEDS